MTGAIVEVQNISVTLGRRTILRDLDLSFGPGVTALLGPNGAGKTTLLRVISGLLRIDAGNMIIAGKTVNRRSPDAAQAMIGLMPQEVGFVPHLRVETTLEYFGLLRGLPVRQLDAEVDRVLAVARLGPRRGDRVSTLSGGMRRRLAFAAALLGKPPLLLLDEPTVGLDPAQRLFFRDAIASAEAEAVIFATHQIEDVALLDCNLTVLLDGAETVQAASVVEFIDSTKLSVWETDKPDNEALLSWRVGTTTTRNVGRRPQPDSKVVDATLEEIYLGLLRERLGDLDA